MSKKETLREAVSLGFGDVVQIAFDISAGRPQWEGALFVVDGPTAAKGHRDIALGEVGLDLFGKDGSVEPYLDQFGTLCPAAVRVFGTLTLEEMRVLVARGWRNVRDPSIALDEICPEGRQREPRFYAVQEVDFRFTDNPDMYAPPEQT